MGNRHSGRISRKSALTLIESTARKNPRPPRPPADPIVKPETLSSEAAAIWDRLAPLCQAMQTLTVADVDAFVTLCELVATHRLATREKARPHFRAITRKGWAHPALKLERETAAALRPYFNRFGLDPLGRARIRLPASDEVPVDKWAGLVG